MKYRPFITLISTLLIFSSSSSKATTVRSLNLEELVNSAQTIVKAEVIGKEMSDDPEESGKLVTYYTLKVQDTLKGDATAGGELIFKQIAQGDYTSDGIMIRQNFYFPEYEVGKTYVFFLPTPHHQTGLLAPVGLFQGVFDVITLNGQETLPQLKARQAMLQKNLGKSTKSKFLAATSTDSSYQAFKGMVESLIK